MPTLKEKQAPISMPKTVGVPQAISALINTVSPVADQYYRVSYGWQGLLEDTIRLLKKWYDPQTPRRTFSPTGAKDGSATVGGQIGIWAMSMIVEAQEFSRKTSGRTYGDREAYHRALCTVTMFAMKLIDETESAADTIAALERMV